MPSNMIGESRSWDGELLPQHRQLQESSHRRRQAELEQELLEAKEQLKTSQEQMAELQSQHLKLEQVLQQDDKLALLQSQRQDLGKRVQQLLQVNGDLRASASTLRQQLQQRESKVEQLKQQHQVDHTLLQRQLLEYQKKTTSAMTLNYRKNALVMCYS